MAPSSSSSLERRVVHFTEARMTVMENASYVELSRPEIDGRLTCSFCDKSSNHDHEFSGRYGVTPIYYVQRCAE